MLQFNKAQSAINREPAAPETISGAETVQLFVGFIRRHLPVIAFVMLLATALSVIYLNTARPMYGAQAQLMIDARKMQLFQQQSVFGDVPIDTAQVESQVEVLKSENIASAVINNLHLTEDPEFVGPGGGLLESVYGFVFSQMGYHDESPSEYELSRRAIGAFQSRLSVSRIGLTYVIQIGFRSYNADRAAQIANDVADAYIVDQLQAKYQATRRASAWLQDRIKELRDQVSVAEQAVVTFKTENNIVSTGGNDKRLVGEQQVTELSSQLVIARAQTAEAKARLDRISAVLKADAPAESFGETVSDTLKSEIVTKLRGQYLDMAAREKDWSMRYGHDHLAVVNLRNQMREIRSSIFEELKRLGETYKSDYEIAKQREAGVQKELTQGVIRSQATDAKSVTLRELESTAQTYKTIYDNFLQRYMEAVQQQSFPITEARLISTASRPLSKTSPNAKRILAVAWMGGIMLALGIGIWRDLSDQVFRNSEQIENLLQVDCIALVPLVKNNLKINKSKSKFSSSRIIARNGSTLWATVDAPLSRYTEAIREIKLANDLTEAGKANRVVGITSSLPNEGKSTIAFSLAHLMSQVGARTILVDCDLRNPSLSGQLAPRAKTGLIDVIAGKVELDDVTWSDRATNMTFLPVGAKPRLAHSSEILNSASTKKLFEKLRESYDYVVVDLPPLAPIVDVRATTHLVDSFIFVIEWGRTKTAIVEHVLGHAHAVYDNLLGVVLNKVNMNILGRYASHKEGLYYNTHYSRYGYTE